MAGEIHALAVKWERERVLGESFFGLVLRLAFRNGDNGQLKIVFRFVVRFAVTGDDAVALDGVVVFRCKGHMIAKDSALFLNDRADLAVELAGKNDRQDQESQRNKGEKESGSRGNGEDQGGYKGRENEERTDGIGATCLLFLLDQFCVLRVTVQLSVVLSVLLFQRFGIGVNDFFTA